MEKGIYVLPPLPYGQADLEPILSREQLKVHYEKHHQSYVKSANDILGQVERAKREDTKLNLSAVSRDLAFNVSGHILHSIFWQTMTPAGKGGDSPSGSLAEAIERDFGSLKRFMEEFSRTAVSVQGSGWAALTYEHQIDRLLIAQIEKHQDNLFPTLPLVMVLDVWEHAYYLDYQNNRLDYIQNWWKIVNWQGTSKRFEEIKG